MERRASPFLFAHNPWSRPASSSFPTVWRRSELAPAPRNRHRLLAQKDGRRNCQPLHAKVCPMKVHVHVSLKPGVLDPQGRAIHHALEGLGFGGVNDVRAGRLIELDVSDDTSDDDLDQMCRKLLANMVIENYSIEKKVDA